jgi:hypothetical protein
MPMLARSAGHVTEEQMVDQVFTFLGRTPAYTNALQQLNGGRIPEPGSDLHGMVWWMIDRHFVQNVPVRGGQFPNKRRVLALIGRNIQLFRAALETEAALEPGQQTTEYAIAQRDSDLRVTIQGVRDFLANLAPWPAVSRVEARALSRQITRESGPVQRAVTRGLQDDLEAMRSLIGLATSIEIQGCNIGQDIGFLRQFQRFFSGAFRPSVSAPNYFQFFGHPGYRIVPSTDSALENLWSDLSIQQAFIDWWNVSYPSLGEPTLDDFTAYLRSGEIFPAEDGLIAIRSLARDAISEWLARHNYRITAKDTIRRRFLGRSITGALGRLWIDWLQDARENPTEILFPPDPRYASHIVRIPGEMGDFEVSEERIRYA